MTSTASSGAFTEVQRFSQTWFAIVILAPAVLFAVGAWWQVVEGHPWGSRPISDGALLTVTAVTLLVSAWLLQVRLITRVEADGLSVQFRWLWPTRRFLWEDIDRVEAVTYRPLRDFGGWGVRYGRRGMAYNVKGNRGVELRLKKGPSVLIGSQRAEELAEAMARRLAGLAETRR